LFKTSFEECKRRQIILERLQKEINCEPPSLKEAPYFWPYYSNRKQREKLAKIHQQISSEQEESIVEQLTDDEVVKSVVMEGHSSLPVWSNDTSDQEDENTYEVIYPNTTAPEGVVQINSQYVIHDTSLFHDDIQHTSIHHTQDISQGQETDQELTDEEVEDCIRQLLSRGVSTVRSYTVVMVMSLSHTNTGKNSDR